MKNYARLNPLSGILFSLIPVLLFLGVPFFGLNIGTAIGWSLILFILGLLADPIGRWMLVLFGLSGR